MKKIDVIIIAATLCMALILWLLPYARGAKTGGITVEIYVDGESTGSYDLSSFESGTEKILTVEAGGGYNVILLSGEGAAITESNCFSQICVRTGRIKNSGSTIVCLPHKLIVKITGGEKNRGEVDAIAG